MATIRLEVNGEARVFEAEGEMPLLWALRDLMGLTGTKYGCGVGSCGACTVHVEGAAARSCLTPVSSVDGKAVTTIEGLGGAHPLQDVWQELDVPQCGYCQAGQIMQAAAFLEDAGEGVEVADVESAMDGNICRCGTYQRIRAAILRAAAEVAS